jgi:hypothetical protein
LDDDFGGSGVFLPGGQAAFLAYTEARSSFVVGNFFATVLLAQAALEQILGGHLRATGFDLGTRVSFETVIAKCREEHVLRPEDEENIRRLKQLRNALGHFKSFDEEDSLERRAADQRTHVFVVAEEDARHAVFSVIFLLSHPLFAFRRTDRADEADD